MWRHFLTKASTNAKLDLDSCNMEYKEQLKAPVSFETASKSDQIILDLSNKSLAQIDQLKHCIPGQFTKQEHIKAAYYDLPVFDNFLDRWNNFTEIQTECTVRWLENKFIQAKSRPNWDDNIWFNAQKERNESSDVGVCDGKNWFKFVDTLNIGPYISHPWTPQLTALIAAEIIKYIQDETNTNTNDIKILDVGCGVGEFGKNLDDIIKGDIRINIDGIDRSIDSLKRVNCMDELKLNDNNTTRYRYRMGIDLCDETDINDFKQFVFKQDEFYDIIVSSDCLEMSYGNNLPGSKAVKDLMDTVKRGGYFLIVNTLQTPATYKVLCLFDDILKQQWSKHGFECIADVVVRGFGDIGVEYQDEYQKMSIENNICFVQLMKRVSDSCRDSAL